MKCFGAAIKVEKNNVLIRVVMLLISCVVNTSKWAGALPGSPGTPLLTRYLSCNCQQPRSLSHGAHSWLQNAPLFFFFHSLLSVSALQNSCVLQREKKRWGVGERELGEPAVYRPASSQREKPSALRLRTSLLSPERGRGPHHHSDPREELP